MKKNVKVNGMHCSSCEILLREAIEEAGVKVVSANHAKGEIVVDMKDENEISKVKKAIEKEGYKMA